MDRCMRGSGLCRRLGSRVGPHWFMALGFGMAGALSIGPVQATLCGGVAYPFPYTDVSGVGAPFCTGIMEAYVTGVSKGTSPTTFSPNDTVIRLQMTTFLQRSLDQGIARTSRRAALNQWWTPQTTNAMQTISIGSLPLYCAADGEFIWTSTLGDLVEVQANTGAVLGTWTGLLNSESLVIAAGKVYVVAQTSPGSLYVIDPTQAPGPVTPAATTLGANPIGIAFDGTNLWTANFGDGSVSIVAPQSPYAVTTVTTGFTNPFGILYDGAHIWVTDQTAGTLLKLNSAGAIVQTVTVGPSPWFPVFDGTNIWVPNNGNDSITVVQASTGNVVATISADASNQLSGPKGASFDGERVLVTNSSGDSVSVFKAADLSFIAHVSTGTATAPWGACSDAINFWVPLENAHKLLRF
jgi:YVTN family beta-propeller protein